MGDRIQGKLHLLGSNVKSFRIGGEVRMKIRRAKSQRSHKSVFWLRMGAKNSVWSKTKQGEARWIRQPRVLVIKTKESTSNFSGMVEAENTTGH